MRKRNTADISNALWRFYITRSHIYLRVSQPIRGQRFLTIGRSKSWPVNRDRYFLSIIFVNDNIGDVISHVKKEEETKTLDRFNNYLKNALI